MDDYKEIEIPVNNELYYEMKRLQDENFHLKRQLKNKNREVKAKVKSIKRLKRKLEEFEGGKQHFRNNKRGSKFQG